jgi:hypothetical protein
MSPLFRSPQRPGSTLHPLARPSPPQILPARPAGALPFAARTDSQNRAWPLASALRLTSPCLVRIGRADGKHSCGCYATLPPSRGATLLERWSHDDRQLRRVRDLRRLPHSRPNPEQSAGGLCTCQKNRKTNQMPSRFLNSLAFGGPAARGGAARQVAQQTRTARPLGPRRHITNVALNRLASRRCRSAPAESSACPRRSCRRRRACRPQSAASWHRTPWWPCRA